MFHIQKGLSLRNALRLTRLVSIILFSTTVLAESLPTSVRTAYAKGELTELCTKAIRAYDRNLIAIAALPPDKRQMENTVLAYEEATADFYDQFLPMRLMKSVSPDSDTRREAEECSQTVAEFFNEVMTRRPLYEAMKDQKGRDPVEDRLVRGILREFESTGINLPDEDLKTARTLFDRLAKLSIEFEQNIRNDTTVVRFTEEELAGVNAGYIAGLERAPDGRLIVPTRDADFLGVMQNAHNPGTRRTMLFAGHNRAADANIPLLEEALETRQRLAHLLGHSTWAHYKTEDRMAKTPAAVQKFLDELRGPLKLGNRRALAELLAFKRQTDPSASQVDAWDVWYLPFQLASRLANVDMDKVREYFPADVVVAGMLQVYSDLLGVTFHQVEGAPGWTPEVKKYEIRDKKSGSTLAYFYMDLYSRPGKSSGAFNATLIMGRRLDNGQYSLPIAAIVANFSPATPGKPPLLTFGQTGEVRTLFHEFGHTMHATLTRARFASHSGTGVKRDFVEAPSQMLENWVWQPEIIEKLSGHYLNPSEKLPRELLEKLVRIKDFQPARMWNRQLTLALYDFKINTQQGPIDSVQIYNDLFREQNEIEPLAGTRMPASFGHLMAGYDAGYYSYLWSKVYAQDMFTEFQKHGFTNAEVGARYRKHILEPGDSEDPEVLVRRFLGREPNQEAFLQSIGAR
ncbi:MAG: M3 family metallopeptidase [Bdellovibrionales bacterium]